MSEQLPLKEVTLFSKLSDTALADLSAALKRRQLAAGQVLFHQGDPGDELIIVEQGAISIYVPVDAGTGDVQPIRIFMPGEILGEMALIDQMPRSLSARAEVPSRILTLRGDDFHRLLAQNPEISLSVMAGLSDRIRYTTDFLSQVRDWVQRIEKGDYQTSGIMDSDRYADQTLATLAAEFAQMAARVQEREETLQREVAQLRIEIDEAKRKSDAARIMGSDYYKELKEKARKLRSRD